MYRNAGKGRTWCRVSSSSFFLQAYICSKTVARFLTESLRSKIYLALLAIVELICIKFSMHKLLKSIRIRVQALFSYWVRSLLLARILLRKKEIFSNEKRKNGSRHTVYAANKIWSTTEYCPIGFHPSQLNFANLDIMVISTGISIAKLRTLLNLHYQEKLSKSLSMSSPLPVPSIRTDNIQ